MEMHLITKIRRIFTVLYRHVVGNQVFDESFGHFLVGESQPIDVEFFVIFLYREVTTLVNHGNGIILERLHVCQCLCSHSFTRKVGQTEVVVFQQFHKVGGGAGLEPVAAELQGTEGIQQARRGYTDWFRSGGSGSRRTVLSVAGRLHRR